MYKRILAPVDGSGPSSRGLNEAIQLAKEQNATLRLLHVINDFPIMVELSDSINFEAVREGLRQSGLALLERASKQAASEGVKTETQLVDQRSGRAADAIVEDAKDHGCDLIVIGTHGRRGVSRMLLGSDAERVLRQSTVPVLLVHDAKAK